MPPYGNFCAVKDVYQVMRPDSISRMEQISAGFVLHSSLQSTQHHFFRAALFENTVFKISTLLIFIKGKYFVYVAKIAFFHTSVPHVLKLHIQHYIYGTDNARHGISDKCCAKSNFAFSLPHSLYSRHSTE